MDLQGLLSHNQSKRAAASVDEFHQLCDSPTPQGAFVDIPEISLCDISYIIKKSILDLGLFPKAHQERLEGCFAGKGYRQLLVDNYIVIFRIDENQRIVYVVTIQYYGRNI